MFLPEEKAENTRIQLVQFLKKSAPRIQEWQSILGKLAHVSQVVTSGRVYLSSVYGVLRGILSQQKHLRRRFTPEICEDLGTWMTLLCQPPEKNFSMLDNTVPIDHTLACDAAASIGFGAVFGKKWFVGQWPDEEWKTKNIAFLELYPIYLAIRIWVHKFTNSVLKVHTDNQSLVSVLNKLYSKDKDLRLLLKPIAKMALEQNFLVVACHVPGKKNVGPDLLSRGHITEFKQQYPFVNDTPDSIPDFIELPK